MKYERDKEKNKDKNKDREKNNNLSLPSSPHIAPEELVIRYVRACSLFLSLSLPLSISLALTLSHSLSSVQEVNYVGACFVFFSQPQILIFLNH